MQLNAATYLLEEALFAGLSGIQVTRTGGSTGAVSATFTANGGTAQPNVHYRPIAVTVRFPDGDTRPRTIPLDILSNRNEEPDRTINLTLSQPGGCAAIGSLASAVVTILDDDGEPPTPPPSGLDTAFGSQGEATSEAFGGDLSAMALAPGGKIVMVGGTFTDFMLAQFDANGTLDTTFDTDGKVTTDMVAGEQEGAYGVAAQADGKIVVVGYTGTAGPGGPTNFAVARYNADGTLDASFGTGGRITSGVLGEAHAVAIQPDGKIVVVGHVEKSSGADSSDFVIARYHANGTLDASFSGDGQVVTDVNAATNTARNVVLQANGSIVVSGEPVMFAGADHTDIARYHPDGTLDTDFGTAGVLALPGSRVGEGLAVQSDGKLVLVGNLDVSTPPASPGTSTAFSTMRRNADGSLDTTFAGGIASTSFTTGRDAALAVALQNDGRIAAK